MKEETLVKEFIPLTNDVLFKYAFGSKDNIKVLEDFLENYYGYEEGYLHGKLRVKMESGIEANRYKDPCIRGDVIVEVEDYSITIDMEAYTRFGMKEEGKSMLYLTRIYSSKYETGKIPKKVQVRQINIVKELVNLYGDKEELKYTFGMGDEKRNQIQMDIVNIEKASKINYTNDRLIKYLQFINAQSYEERKNIAEGDKMLMEFDNWLDKFMNDPKIIQLQKEKAELKLQGEIEYELKQEAKKEGREEGIKARNIEIAKKLLAKNESIKEICDITGLSKEEINNLK